MAANVTYSVLKALGLETYVADASGAVHSWMQCLLQEDCLSVVRTLVPYHYLSVFLAVDSVALLMWHFTHFVIFASFYAFANPIYASIDDREALYSVGSLSLTFTMLLMMLYHMSDPPGVALHARDAIHYGFPALAYSIPVLTLVDIVMRVSIHKTIFHSFRSWMGNTMLTVCCICAQYSYCISTHEGRALTQVAKDLKEEIALEARSAWQRRLIYSSGGIASNMTEVAVNMSVTMAAGVEEVTRSLVGKGSRYCGTLDEPRQLPFAILSTFIVIFLWSIFFNRFARHGILLIHPVTRSQSKKKSEDVAAGLGVKPQGPDGHSTEEQMNKLLEERPTMSSWYNTNLVYTVTHMFVSVKIFLGRFDVRTMKAALAGVHHVEEAAPQQPFDVIAKDELWFDFVADTGDGFNPTYAIARSIAQPHLTVAVPCPQILKRLKQKVSRILHGVLPTDFRSMAESKMPLLSPLARMGKSHSTSSDALTRLDKPPSPMNSNSLKSSKSVASFASDGTQTPINSKALNLPRGELLLHGGDLAYPVPALDVYTQRLLRPYEAALEPPPGANIVEVASKVNAESSKIAEKCAAPVAWIIPGNHDWFDGLETFLHLICGRHWFGGWHLPQTNMYWALELPHDWFVLGFDLGLNDDLDDIQYTYFRSIVSKLPKDANVICITHGPNWYLDSYYKRESCRMYSEILRSLGPKLRMLLAGDIHNYSRYSPKIDQDHMSAPELITAGGGGAFLHPTHINVDVEGYSRTAVYPSAVISRALALRNPFQFRRRNWAWEVVLGGALSAAVVPIMPLCGYAETAFASWSSGKSFLWAWSELVCQCYMMIFETTYLALAMQVFIVISLLILMPEAQWGQLRRILWGLSLGIPMALCSIVVACGLELALMQLGMEGHDQNRGNQAEPPKILLNLPPPWNDFSVWVVRSLVTIADLPTHIYHARHAVCEVGLSVAPRSFVVRYTVLMLPYFWIVACPIAVFIFGSYLAIASLWGRHLDEAFSSLRIENYKSFLRMHIDTEGTLHLYAIGIDNVPRHWKEDPLWRREMPSGTDGAKGSRPPSLRTAPSRWMPIGGDKSHLIDYVTFRARCRERQVSPDADLE